MNLQRREEIRVIAECPNDRHWAQEMRRAVAELLAHIDALEQTAAERVIADGSRGPTPDYTGEGSAWVPPVEAQAVVVPELTDEEVDARLRAIPADRELMRLVDELIRWHGLRPLDKRPDHAAALVGAIKALRAQPTQELAP